MGYGKLNWCGRRDLLAHRVAFELAYGVIPWDMSVCHDCDNPVCCNPEHLWMGTAADNSLDMLAKGRCRSGAQGDTSERDDSIVRLRGEGLTCFEIAEKVGCSASTVHKVVRRRNESRGAV